MSARGSRPRLGALALLIASCADARDPSLREVLIHYESRPVEDLAAEGLRVDWQTVSGRLRVGSVVSQQSLPSVAARPPAEHERESEPETVGVVEGETGRIWSDVGVRATTSAITPYGVPEDPDSVEEGEVGFDVTPHVLPDGRVRLELVPFDERRETPTIGGASRASTTVTLAPSTKVAVGALAHESAGGGSGFASIGQAPPREERVLVVEVEIETDD